MASGASSGVCRRAKRAAGGGAAGRPRIVAEGDVLRVVYIYNSNYITMPKKTKIA